MSDSCEYQVFYIHSYLDLAATLSTLLLEEKFTEQLRSKNQESIHIYDFVV